MMQGIPNRIPFPFLSGYSSLFNPIPLCFIPLSFHLVPPFSDSSLLFTLVASV